jgi:tRNA A37 threonylcarbamoyladenosine dehydratase
MILCASRRFAPGRFNCEVTSNYSDTFLATYSGLKNIGLFTMEEQKKIREAIVFVARLGGVGSYQTVSPARQGIGELRIMGPGVFDECDFNRQYGAPMSTVS